MSHTEPLEEFSGQAYRNFIQALHSPFSKISYKSTLKLYMQYRKVTDCEQLLQGDNRLLQSQIIDYVIYLREEKKITSGTIQTTLAIIRKFYEMNDIELKWRRINSYIGHSNRKKKGSDRPYTCSEVARMLEKADHRERVILLLMYSSGIRVGALGSLKINSLEAIDKYSLFKIRVYQDEPEEYITFCSPECKKAIDDYLEYRRRCGERIKDDAPLIREEFDINDEIHAARPRQLTVHTFRTLIRRLGYISGVIERRSPDINETSPNNLRAPRKRRAVKETHGFRKAFETTAITSGMAPLYVSMLMGHNSGLELASYFKPTENDLLEGNDKMIGYVGVIDALTINEENKLRRENKNLKEKEIMRNQKLDELQKRFDAMEKKLGF